MPIPVIDRQAMRLDAAPGQDQRDHDAQDYQAAGHEDTYRQGLHLGLHPPIRAFHRSAPGVERRDPAPGDVGSESAGLWFVFVSRVRAQSATVQPSLVRPDGMMCQRKEPLAVGSARSDRVNRVAHYALWLFVLSGMRSKIPNWLAQYALWLVVLPGMPVVGHRFTPRG